jgi:predicted regulator of Ras-like GTPase activity (Roadblock/LC7/MglB family)
MTPNRNFGYLLDEMCDQVPGIHHALLVSGDGLKIAISRNLPEDVADQLSAYTSGVASMTKGAARLLNGGEVEQNTTEMATGFLIVMAIDTRTALTVLARKDCDLGQVTYEMGMLTNRIGASLAPDLRQPQRA